MSHKTLLAIIPLILLIGIIQALPFSDAAVPHAIYSEDSETKCRDGHVLVVRVTNSNPICIDQNTAQRWAQLGIAEIVGEPIEEGIEEGIEETIAEFQYTSIPNDLSRAQSYLVTISGGELTEPVTFQTFSKIEPGEKHRYIASFHDLGLDTYFSLESIPSTDKIDFYKLVAKTINPGKAPELFDVSIDVLAGDNSVIVTVNYPKCVITNYTPYSQELFHFLLSYQHLR